MIRLLVFVVGLFLVWLLFFSALSRKLKTGLAGVVIALMFIALWIENSGTTPRGNVVSIQDLQVCGVAGQHSYRTNFDIDLCLQNNASAGTVKRVQLQLIAEQCQNNQCQPLETVTRTLNMDIPAGEQISHTANIPFNAVSPTQENLAWKATIDQVWAVR